MAGAARGSASCCRTRRASSTSCASSRSMHTEAINHDPAITFFQTGAQLAGPAQHGRLGLPTGSAARTDDLPAFVVMVSQGTGNPTDQPLYDRLWGSGFLPSQVSGRQVPLRRRSGAVPVQSRRASTPRRAGACSTISAALNQIRLRGVRRSRRSRTRIAQYETGVPHANVGARVDRYLQASRRHVFDLYGPDARKPGHIRRQLPARPPAGRARRAFHPALPSRLGPAHATCRGRSPASAATPTSPRPR